MAFYDVHRGAADAGGWQPGACKCNETCVTGWTPQADNLRCQQPQYLLDTVSPHSHTALAQLRCLLAWLGC